MIPRMRTIQEAEAELREDRPGHRRNALSNPAAGVGRHHSPCTRGEQAAGESGYPSGISGRRARSRTGQAHVRTNPAHSGEGGLIRGTVGLHPHR